jgi:hypothetical protein
MPLPRRKPRAPSEGVFFAVRVPDHWQLCTFRFDECGAGGIPDFWVQTLGPLLNLWLHHFEKNDPDHLVERHTQIERSLGQLVAGYDAFPRGQITCGASPQHFVVRHSDGIERVLPGIRKEVDAAFGIVGRTRWIADHESAVSAESAELIRQHLPIEESWEPVKTK